MQSARFVSVHKKNPSAELSIHGVEKTDETGRLCRMNLAVHGLEGDIWHGGQVNIATELVEKHVVSFVRSPAPKNSMAVEAAAPSNK